MHRVAAFFFISSRMSVLKDNMRCVMLFPILFFAVLVSVSACTVVEDDEVIDAVVTEHTEYDEP